MHILLPLCLECRWPWQCTRESGSAVFILSSHVPNWKVEVLLVRKIGSENEGQPTVGVTVAVVWEYTSCYFPHFYAKMDFFSLMIIYKLWLLLARHRSMMSKVMNQSITQLNFTWKKTILNIVWHHLNYNIHLSFIYLHLEFPKSNIQFYLLERFNFFRMKCLQRPWLVKLLHSLADSFNLVTSTKSETRSQALKLW